MINLRKKTTPTTPTSSTTSITPTTRLLSNTFTDTLNTDDILDITDKIDTPILSYSGISNSVNKVCIKEKQDTFMIPVKNFQIDKRYRRTNTTKWLNAENCDKQNVYLLEELFELMLSEFSTLGYYLRSDKVRTFTDFASWCYENSSDFEIYK